METNAAYQKGDGKDKNYSPTRNDLISAIERLRRGLAGLEDGRYSMCVSRAIPSLLGYDGNLLELDVDRLSKMGNMGKDAARLVHRVLQGETVEAIFGDPNKKGEGLAGEIRWKFRG